LTEHAVVGHEDWLKARTELLAREKEFTRARDELNRLRRDLPWEAVDKEYVFEGRDGRKSLGDLFEGRSQLVVYHFMFQPDWHEGCKSCSFWADNFDPVIVHMNARDVSMVAISRAPFAKLRDYQERMGWSFRWLSSFENDFNYDFGVSFRPEEYDRPVYNYGTLPPGMGDREGMSIFVRADDGRIFHTYSSYARGIDLLNTAYNYIDLVPKGRDEQGRSQSWVRRHDEYGA
jgi:predicted dithiol-disulfide oxidoreductase (DUF899 family)